MPQEVYGMEQSASRAPFGKFVRPNTTERVRLCEGGRLHNGVYDTNFRRIPELQYPDGKPTDLYSFAEFLYRFFNELSDGAGVVFDKPLFKEYAFF